MNNTYVQIAAVVVVFVVGVVFGLAVARRRRAERLREDFGPEYDRTVQTLGDERKALTDLEERKKHVEGLRIRPLSADERGRFRSEWSAVQSKFVDEPGPAILDADRMITEVMRARGYPVADFEQQAADLSVSYPQLVINYRAARELAAKNEQHQADTEELRQALIHYRSLFEELVGTEAEGVREKQI